MSTTTPPIILISISTSSPILDRSSSAPFTIILTANTSSQRPIVIDTSNTILNASSKSLDYEGLSFTDVATGQLAERRQIDVQFQVPERLRAKSSDIAEIPPTNSGKEGYKVNHSFKRSTPSPSPEPLTREAAAERRWMTSMADQTVGLLPGHRYRVGLGDSEYMRQVRWWREGNKAEVFLRGSLSPAVQSEPWLEMEVVPGGEAEFEVFGEAAEWTEEDREALANSEIGRALRQANEAAKRARERREGAEAR